MLGTKLVRNRDRERFEVVGQDGNAWALAPEEFGATISVSLAELEHLFTVDGDVMPSPNTDEAAGWRGLAERHADAEVVGARRAKSDRAITPDELSPEEIFASAALTADQIVSSPVHLRSFFAERLAVSAEVAEAVRKAVAAKPASEIASDGVLVWAFSDGRLVLAARKAREVRGLIDAAA